MGTIILSPKCYNKGCCECLLVHPTGEKLTFENLPWVAPIPRQTIDRRIKVSCDAYRKLVTVNLRSTNWSSNLTLNNVWFQKLSIRPPWKGFFLRLPHLPGNFSQASYIYLNAWAFENASQPPPPPPPEFPIPSVGGVWIFSGTTQCNFYLKL